MLAEERRQRILELIQEEGSARVKALSRIFSVTEPTIRQDLERLEREGWVVREHGGAYLRNIGLQVRTGSLQHEENIEKKIVIAKKAAQFVEDYDSIILDSGSTVTELSKRILDREHLSIVTNALNIALILGSMPSFHLHVTGGEFKAPTLSLTGEKAASFFSDIHVDKLFLAAAGVSFEAGLTYPGFNDLPVKEAMIHSARQVILLADSTKIGRSAFAALGKIELLDTIVTDAGISGEDIRRFEQLGIQVVVASLP
jgi:DeoR/GlpR family transcriptional regulator of sugar metabolism